MRATNDNDVLPAAAVAASLLILAIGASKLVAQQPAGPASEQAGAKPPINLAEAGPKDGETPIYGLTLHGEGDDAPRVMAVETDTPAAEAGLRPGDELVAFGDVKGVPYEAFLEGARKVADETYNNDTIEIVYRRNGEEHTTEMSGVGRSPASLRKLEERSEKAIAEKLQPEAPSASRAATTDEIESYLELRRRYMTGAELTADEYDNYHRLGAVVVGGGGLYGGGYLSGGGFAGPASTGPRWTQTRESGDAATRSGGAPTSGIGAATGGDRATPGTDIGTAAQGQAMPGSGIGDDPTNQGREAALMSSQLGADLQRLQQMRQSGAQMTPDQTSRLAALEQLASGSVAGPRGSTRAMTQPFQAELGQLQQASRAGGLSMAQQRRFSQLQQMQQAAVTGPGANRNMPRLPNSGLPGATQAGPAGQAAPGAAGANPGASGGAPSNAGAARSSVGRGSN